MLLSSVSTVLAYGLSLYYFKQYLSVTSIDGVFLAKVAVIVALSWLPIHLFVSIKSCLFPSQQNKLKSIKSLDAKY